MATASPYDAALRDAVHRLSTSVTELDRHEDLDRLVEKAVALAVALTGSIEGVIAIGSQGGGFDRFISRAAESGASLTDEAVGELLELAGISSNVPGRRRGKVATRGPLAASAHELRAGGQLLGVIAVGRGHEYRETEREVLAIFASHAALALDAVQLRQRQHSLEAAVLELRSWLDEQQTEANATAEKLRTAERVERAHELAVQVLLAVSSHAVTGQSLSDFYRRLA
ncbi:MAG TPA: GAF domain-containing protein, partial [Candidatus Udaeobacter sp.]|nr:GAF domain-containing protein [Candidatus Udaeobacter sp.]